MGRYRVMVVHEGGKECAYTLAFLRAAQLSIAGRFAAHLYIAHTMRLWMAANMMERIQTQCSELFIYDGGQRGVNVLVDERALAGCISRVLFRAEHRS